MKYAMLANRLTRPISRRCGKSRHRLYSGQKQPLRQVRAFSFWIVFKELELSTDIKNSCTFPYQVMS